MLTHMEEEKIVGNILSASFEALTLNDIGTNVMPLFEDLFDTSNSLLYRCDDTGKLVKFGGTMEEAHYRYTDLYYSSDPMQTLLRRLNLWITNGPRYPEWKKFLRLPVYHDHAKRHEIDNYIHIRLNEFGHNEPGMAGMLFARTARQPEFSDHDELILARVLPALEALTRRDARIEEQLRSHTIVETMLDLDLRPKIALDPSGKLLWTSERAEKLLKLRHGKWQVLPDVLVKAARQLGALTLNNSVTTAPPSSIVISQDQGAPIRAELRLARTRTGSPFVVAELDLTYATPQLSDAAERFQLTMAETQVLGLLAKGLSDQEISRHLFVSMATVRTHVGRILDKLGVRSRVQAALLAHGHQLEHSQENE
jgi:DNA-binding CsgD family transcriptional regulator